MAQQQSTSRRRRRRRLRALAAAVSSAAVERARPWPGDPFTNRSANEPDPEASAALLHKLAQKPDGSVEPRELEELATRERAAAESRDYRLAAQLRDLQEVLRPSSLKLRDCMPPTVDEQYAFFLKQGFCVLPDVLAPPQLREIQSAWERIVPGVRAKWKLEKRGGEGISGIKFQKPPEGFPDIYRTFFDIPQLLEQDDAFLSLVDCPKVVALLSRLAGQGGLQPGSEARGEFSPYHGIAQCGGFQARTIPPEGNGDGYISWHRDKPPADGWPLPNYRVIKVILNFWDVGADGGATAVVRHHATIVSRHARHPCRTFDYLVTSIRRSH